MRSRWSDSLYGHDELRLMVFPVAIGHGLRVFPEERSKLSWKLADQTAFPTGVLALTYHQG